MSNYLSKNLDYGTTISTDVTDILFKVAMAKEEKYNLAQNAIQNTVDQYGALAQNLREKGKEYLAGKLDAVTQLVNNSGDRDLSKSGVARAINSQIKNIVQDPIVLNEINQSQKIQAFSKDVERLKEKSPDRFDEGNYQDALNMAGVESFMSGETDKVGNLVYHDYVNVPELLNKNAQTYVDKNGKEQYLGTQRAGDLAHPYDIQKFGVRVSTDDIQSHLINSLDSKAMAQMQINARRTIGADSSVYMIEQLSDENSKNKDFLAQGLAQMKGMSAEEAAQYEPQIAALKKAISDNDIKIKTGNFSINDAYQTYANRVTRDVAGEYDRDIITKFDVDKMPYEIAKDDRNYALEVEKFNFQKQKSLIESQEKIDVARKAALGIATDVVQTDSDKEQSDFTNIRQATHRSAAALDLYLAKNDPNYKLLDEKEKWNYKLYLDAENPKIKGNTAEYRNLVEDFQASQKQYANIVSTTTDGIQSTTTDIFNQMLQGKGTSDLNIRNLSNTMPLTATMLGRKDITSFNNLSTAQKYGVIAEFASNNLQYNNKLTGDVRAAYERSVTGLKAKLEGLKTTDSKIILSTIKGSTSTEERSGVGSIYAGNILTGALALEKKVIAPVANALEYGFNRVFNNEEIADARLRERQATDALVAQDLSRSFEDVREVNRDLFYTDSNITEIQGRDLSGGIAAKTQFDVENERLKKLIEEKSAGYSKNLSDKKAYTFSTSDKGQASTARALRAAVLNSSDAPEVPEGSNDYTIQREGEGYRIGFTKKTKLGQERSSIYVDTLPTTVSNTFNETQQDWKNSPFNPDIKLTPQTFLPETSAAKRNVEVRNISENLTDVMSQQMIAQLQTDPSKSPFKTTIEFGNQIIQNRGADFFQRNQQVINNILNSKFTAAPKVTSDPNNPFWVDIYYTDPTTGQEVVSSQPLTGREKNNSSFYLQYSIMINNLKENLINNLNGQ